MIASTVSAGLAGALFDYAVARGADGARLRAQAGLGPAALDDPDKRVPLERYVSLMRAAKSLSGDPALALKFGAETDFRRFSIVGLIAHASATMAEALEQMNRYSRLVAEVVGVSDGPRFVHEMREGKLWLEDRRRDPNDFPEMTESTLSRFICGARRDFPQETFAYAATVTHAAPPYAAEYERLWGVPVTFNAPRNAIEMNARWPSVQIQPHNRYVFGVFSAKAEALLESLQRSGTLSGEVESLVMTMLHTGGARADVVAARLGVSRQTLYRRLKSEGASYDALVNDLRRRLALHYLSERKVSVNETAYLVGFSDPTAFSRAFKRWTGSSPRQYFAAARDG
jgi:AraC-like DNA-binding protein